ncbi:MAG: hypothetical protein ACLU00_07240 [Mediterraneibacter faecis]
MGQFDIVGCKCTKGRQPRTYAANHEGYDEDAACSERGFIKIFTAKYNSINDLRYEKYEND